MYVIYVQCKTIVLYKIELFCVSDKTRIQGQKISFFIRHLDIKFCTEQSEKVQNIGQACAMFPSKKCIKLRIKVD